MSRRAALAMLGLCALVAGCGEDAGGASGGTPRLVVSAAASMKDALGACGPSFPGATR